MASKSMDEEKTTLEEGAAAPEGGETPAEPASEPAEEGAGETDEALAE